MRNLDYLSDSLSFDIAFKKSEEITTKFGRIDFILEDHRKNQLLVELETILNSRNKLDYCFSQIANYKKLQFQQNTDYCILYAKETKSRQKSEIQNFGIENNILIRNYSLNKVKDLYAKTVEKLSLSFGLVLPKPKNYTICYLRFMEVTNGEWIPNLKMFEQKKLDIANGLFSVDYKSRTMYEFLNFACNWCLELGLVERIKTAGSYDKVFLTPLGIEINNIFSLDLQIKKSRLNLNFKYIN